MRPANLGKKVAAFLQVIMLTLSFGMVSVAVAGPALAADGCNIDGSAKNLTIEQGAECSKGNSASSNLFGDGGVFKIIANTLIFLVGAIAVIFLIVGGLRYVISNGDPKNVESAKNTILYAVVGIVIAIISYAVVDFVVKAFSASSQ